MLTKRQRKLLDFIKSFSEKNKMMPTRLEMAEGMGYSQNAAHEALKAIEKKGFIKVLPKTARGIITEVRK